MEKIRVVKAGTKIITCPFENTTEGRVLADKWYQRQISKARPSGELYIAKNHTVEDIDNPDYKPEWEVNRREKYTEVLNEQIELIVDALVYGKKDALDSLKAINDKIKSDIPKTEKR